MKLYFITSINDEYIGVNKKINSQLKGFEKLGLNVELVNVYKKNNFYRKIIRRISLSNHNMNWSNINTKSIDTCYYFRYSMSDISFIRILKKIKREAINSKIIIEIPTYPYYKEKDKARSKFMEIKDRFYKKYLFKYVDRIVTFSEDEHIFGIPTIQISNGVDTSLITQRKIKKHDSINLVIVATFDYWHGYDRLINGLSEYYNKGGKQKIFLHFVGDGPEISNYKNLSDTLQLNPNIVFYGRLVGEELDQIYDIADLAIDSLGRHRTGVFYNSTLKGKEYIAKGMPIVSGVRTELDNFPDYPYYHRVAADESYININDIITFYNNIYSNKNVEDVIKDIRNFAINNFDMTKCLEPIVDYLTE